MNGDDFFENMTKEAMKELTAGDCTWKEANHNVVILACFGMLYNHLGSKLVKPLWFFAGSVASGVIWYVVSSVIGLR